MAAVGVSAPPTPSNPHGGEATVASVTMATTSAGTAACPIKPASKALAQDPTASAAAVDANTNPDVNHDPNRYHQRCDQAFANAPVG